MDETDEASSEVFLLQDEVSKQATGDLFNRKPPVLLSDLPALGLPAHGSEMLLSLPRGREETFLLRHSLLHQSPRSRRDSGDPR